MKKCCLVAFVAAMAVALLSGPLWTAGPPEKTVCLMWVSKSGMAKRVADGFFRRMEVIAPEVRIIQRVQLSGEEDAAAVLRELGPVVDGIVYLRSPGAEHLARAHLNKPCFVGACNSPGELGVVKNMEAPEGNITGVTYYIPYEKRFEAIKEVFPQAKSVALLAEAGHPATAVERAGTRAQCQRLGMMYHEAVAPDLRELETAMEKLASDVDLFLSAATRLTIDSITLQTSIANRYGKPIFSFAEGRTRMGATAELAADDVKLGSMLADSVVDVVVRGKPVRDVPVKTDPAPVLVINESMVKQLGLEVPEATLKKARLVK